MNDMVSLIAQLSWRGALLILLIAILRAPLRQWIGNAWINVLWVAIALRLLLPWSIESRWSVFNFSPRQFVQTLDAGQSTDARTMPTVRVGVKSQPVSKAGATQRVESQAASQSKTTTSWWAVAWLIGCVVGLLHLGARIWQTRLLRSRTRLATHPTLLEAFLSIPASIRRRVTLRESDTIAVPALVGAWRPEIWFPGEWCDRLDVDQQRQVLLHELGHARRGDLLAQWLMALMRCVHWFNPLVWVADLLSQADRELACDDWVMRHAEERDAEEYGSTLLEAAKLLRRSTHLCPTAIAMAAHRKGLLMRVRNIGQHQLISRWRVAAGLSLASVLFLVLATDRLQAQAPLPTPVPTTEPAPLTLPVLPAAPGASAAPQASNLGSANEDVVEVRSQFVQIPRSLLKEGGVFAGDMTLTPVPSNRVLDADTTLELSKRMAGTKGVDLLAAPKMTVRSGQRGVIEIVREFRYGTKFVDDAAAPDGLRATVFETRNTGVSLDVEPTVKADGSIDLAVGAEVTEVTGFTRLRDGQQIPGNAQKSSKSGQVEPPKDVAAIPNFSTRKITANLKVHPGNSTVIGGLDRGSSELAPGEEPQHILVIITASRVDPKGERKARAGAASVGVAPISANAVDALLFGRPGAPVAVPSAAPSSSPPQPKPRKSRGVSGIPGAPAAGSPPPPVAPAR